MLVFLRAFVNYKRTRHAQKKAPLRGLKNLSDSEAEINLGTEPKVLFAADGIVVIKVFCAVVIV